MDINCIDQCIYQKEGKCTLNTINEFQSLTQRTQYTNTSCSYYIPILSYLRTPR